MAIVAGAGIRECPGLRFASVCPKLLSEGPRMGFRKRSRSRGRGSDPSPPGRQKRTPCWRSPDSNTVYVLG